jgi:hypothetical protein
MRKNELFSSILQISAFEIPIFGNDAPHGRAAIISA